MGFYELVDSLKGAIDSLKSLVLSDADVTVFGVSKPSITKQVSEKIDERWASILAVAHGRQSVELKADLPASPIGEVLIDVWNDPVPSNNGLYGWSVDAWHKSPFDANRVALDSQYRAGKTWLGQVLTHDYQDSIYGSAVVRAILAVKGVGVDPGKNYFIKVFTKNHATYKDKIAISSGEGADWTTGDVEVPDKNNGPVIVTASKLDGSRFELLVDYSLLSDVDGVLVNTLDPYLPISGASIFESDLNLRIEELGNSQSKIDAEVLTPFIDRDRLNLEDSKRVAIAESIVGARLLKGDTTKEYAITVFSHKDVTYNNNIAITDGSAWVASLSAADFSPNAKGITRVVVPPVNSSGVEIELYINYEALEGHTGVLINGSDIWLRLSNASIAGYISDEVDRLGKDIKSEVSSVVPSRNLKVSLLGSSTTWGKGYLGELSYVGEVEDFLRNELSDTLVPSDIQAEGDWQVISNESMCYKSEIGRLSGVGAEIHFSSHGDEVSLAMCKERGNSGAAVIELLVDGIVHDTFSTYNPLPFGSDVFNFIGDGVSKTFDLGYSFTYGHIVSLDSVELLGKINQGGYGGTFDVGDEWMVVRKLVDIGSGDFQVRHFLTFREAPASGVEVSCSFDYGESIKPTKSSVGNVAKTIGSGLESPYGEGTTAHDPANPVGLSSGLDFRQSDHRAIKTWRFTTRKTRNFSFRVKSLDLRSTGVVPEFFVGFITNRMHYIQNAGIGGYKASSFLETDNLTNLRQVISFDPDFILIKLAANDDWDAHEFKAWHLVSGVSDLELRSVDSSHYLKAISGSGDQYAIEDSRCLISGITPFSVTLDSSVVLGLVAKGDQLIFGDYKGDARRLVVRIVESWDGHTATFSKELLVGDLAHIGSLSDLIGTTAQVKSISLWEQNLALMLTKLQESLPGVQIGLSTDGLPNYNMRRLEGYAESAKLIANSFEKVDFIDSYGETKRWTYENTQDTEVYIDQAQGSLSTGVAEYQLFDAAGEVFDDWAPRNISVLVDGVERINDGCHIKGGQKMGWPLGVVTMSLDNDVPVVDQHTLVFTNNIPSAGSSIVVRYMSAKWSADDCHPGAIGNVLFGKVAKGFLKGGL